MNKRLTTQVLAAQQLKRGPSAVRYVTQGNHKWFGSVVKRGPAAGYATGKTVAVLGARKQAGNGRAGVKVHQAGTACSVASLPVRRNEVPLWHDAPQPFGSYQVASLVPGPFTVFGDEARSRPIPKSTAGAAVRVANVGCTSKAIAPLETLVIGRTDKGQLARSLRPGEHTLLPKMVTDLGSVKANWKRNASLLRAEMRKGRPIRDNSYRLRDADRADFGTGRKTFNNHAALRGRTARETFTGMERNLLLNRGWTLQGEYWHPPPHK